MHSDSDINWARLEDKLQQDEAFRSHDRIESARPVDSKEPQFDESDPWAWDYKPWPAPPSVQTPDPSGNSLRSKAIISSTANQIFGAK